MDPNLIDKAVILVAVALGFGLGRIGVRVGVPKDDQSVPAPRRTITDIGEVMTGGRVGDPGRDPDDDGDGFRRGGDFPRYPDYPG